MGKVRLDELPHCVGNVQAMLAIAAPKKTATTIWLIGALGAGKTTFAQEFARKFGVTETVQSPTYVLMKTYLLPHTLTSFGTTRRFKKLVHIDAYRLERPDEFSALQPDTFLNDPSALVLVEWPDRIESVLPPPDIVVRFSSEGAGEEERFIEVEK